jgi:hypothetical protein
VNDSGCARSNLRRMSEEWPPDRVLDFVDVIADLRERRLGVGQELCLNLGDGVDQAAEIASRTISIPSLNFAPLMIFGNWF